MHITPQDDSSSTKKKDLAFKANQEKGKARVEYESSSDDEIDDASLALMVRRTAKMLKKLNKSVIKFDGKKKKFFTSSRRQQEMDCYNCRELGHLAHQCTKPKKDKFKNKYKDKKDDSINEDEDEKKKKNKPYKKKDNKKKDFHKKKKSGKAYIVSDWLMNIDSSSCSSDDDSDNEKVAATAIDLSSSPPSLPSSSTHLCLMAKGERKVSNDDSSGDECNTSGV